MSCSASSATWAFTAATAATSTTVRSVAIQEGQFVHQGDLLFTLANLCRHLELDPESCLREANAKFARRFRAVEAEVTASGRDWRDHDPDSLDALWRRAKAAKT